MSDISGTLLDLSGQIQDNTAVFTAPKIPIFLIAMLGNQERKDNIDKLIQQFNPFVVKAVLRTSPHYGNCLSHLEVARKAKLLFPDKPYLVLEDDAEVKDPKFWTLMEDASGADIVYLGYNGDCNHTTPINTNYIWGTHAVVINPKARDAIIEHFEWANKLDYWTKDVGFDSYLTVITHKAGLTYWAPSQEDRYKYICQKDGFVSFLSGHTRRNNL